MPKRGPYKRHVLNGVQIKAADAQRMLKAGDIRVFAEFWQEVNYVYTTREERNSA